MTFTSPLPLKFVDALYASFSAETSYDPENWTQFNPAYGQCAVAALVVQDYFQGKIYKVSLAKTHWANLKAHFFNAVLQVEPFEGQFWRLVDTTASQFGEGTDLNELYAIPQKSVTRSHLLKNVDTRQWYEMLADRVRTNLV